ncbi:hypothetical protein ACTQ1U_12935 [Thermoguttaceae bacterium LCP21S3_D4]
MKKKTKIILACIAACIIVAAVAVVIKMNLDKQAKNKSLTEGETAIETYLQSFDEENEEGKKAEIYTSFQSDEKITSVIEKYFQNKETKKEDWYQNYSKANKKMYQYFVDYFNDLISTESDNFENDKSIAACDTMIENLNNISDTLEQDAIIKSDDKDSIKDTLSEVMGRVNDEINSIVDNYNATYESYVISDVENASKDDLNTAITNLNTLKDELTNLGTDHFTDIITNIDNDVETYTNKVSEIEEAEKKKQEEKKKKEAAAANNNSNSNNSNNSSSNSSSTSSRGGLSQSSWAITGNCWDDSEGQNIIYNAPQVIYDAYNNGKSYVWYASNGECSWEIEYDPVVYTCDRYGNILYTN